MNFAATCIHKQSRQGTDPELQHLHQDLVFERATLQVLGDNVSGHRRLGSDFSISRSRFVVTIANIFHYVPGLAEEP